MFMFFLYEYLVADYKGRQIVDFFLITKKNRKIIPLTFNNGIYYLNRVWKRKGEDAIVISTMPLDRKILIKQIESFVKITTSFVRFYRSEGLSRF